MHACMYVCMYVCFNDVCMYLLTPAAAEVDTPSNDVGTPDDSEGNEVSAKHVSQMFWSIGRIIINIHHVVRKYCAHCQVYSL